jgi:predicted SprT family Zn-dependent metalloprotease
MAKKSLTLKQLKRYASRKGKIVTDRPIKTTLEDLPKNKAGRSYDYHCDEQNKRLITAYGVGIDSAYFNQNKYNREEIYQIFLHELAHIPVPSGHGPRYKRFARKLGVDEDHMKQVIPRTKLIYTQKHK